SFVLHLYPLPAHLHSFPTRRSSDLRNVAGRPLFVVRGSDGKVRVFLNTCTHRGALICRRDQGNTEVLQCFYHAWTFNNQGELIGDRKSTRLNSSHQIISYAVFCLKK